MNCWKTLDKVKYFPANVVELSNLANSLGDQGGTYSMNEKTSVLPYNHIIDVGLEC